MNGVNLNNDQVVLVVDTTPFTGNFFQAGRVVLNEKKACSRR